VIYLPELAQQQMSEQWQQSKTAFSGVSENYLAAIK
jgi:hypothetical protein